LNTIVQNIWGGLAGGSWLDQLNLALGIAGVALMIRRSVWTFPVSLVAVTVQGVLFFRAKFFADTALQIFFFVALAWGWWHWSRPRDAAPELPITVMTWRSRLVTVALATAATAAWALTVGRWTSSPQPWRDAFIAAFQVAAQIAQARKQLENWPLWILANGVAVVAYWRADLAYTAFLFGVYLVLAVVGWREWARAMRGAATP
jgi:nicotinamide mononucleotide transporter